MGIKRLNQYILKKCSNQAIKKISFDQLTNKKVVVDISIFIYKFLGEQLLMGQMYTFLSLFKYYKITPIFIFDGKPPPEKMELLRKRRYEKRDARDRYDIITSGLEKDASGNIIAEASLLSELDILRKKMVKMTQSDLLNVKELLDAFGFLYYTAEGEADELCAYFINSRTVDICISDDMDMFLFGCSKVLRNISLMNHTGVLYDTELILNDLNLQQCDLLEIMVAHGTDYNQREGVNVSTYAIGDIIRMYREYKESLEKGFYNWLNNHTLIKQDVDILTNNCTMFDLMIPAKKSSLETFVNRFHLEIGKKMNVQKIKDLMQPYGFIFV